MNQVTVLLFAVLVLSACSDRLEHKNQKAIEELQGEVMTLKKQAVALEQKQNKAENAKSLSNIYIAPPTFKSEIDARLASATIEKGIEAVGLHPNEIGGTDLTLISGDGRWLKTLHSEKDFSEALQPIGGHFWERIVFLLEKDPEHEQATSIKKAILSMLEDKSQV